MISLATAIVAGSLRSTNPEFAQAASKAADIFVISSGLNEVFVFEEWSNRHSFRRNAAQFGGGLRQILHTDARQFGGESFLGLPQNRQHDVPEQRGIADWSAVQFDGRAGRAQYIHRP